MAHQEVVVATEGYQATQDNQLSFDQNDRIVILTKDEETGWYTGRLEKNNKVGLFPSTITVLKNDDSSTKKKFKKNTVDVGSKHKQRSNINFLSSKNNNFDSGNRTSFAAPLILNSSVDMPSSHPQSLPSPIPLMATKSDGSIGSKYTNLSSSNLTRALSNPKSRSKVLFNEYRKSVLMPTASTVTDGINNSSLTSNFSDVLNDNGSGIDITIASTANVQDPARAFGNGDDSDKDDMDDEKKQSTNTNIKGGSGAGDTAYQSLAAGGDENISWKHEYLTDLKLQQKRSDPLAEMYYHAPEELGFRPHQKTRFGIAAHYQAYLSCLGSVGLGLICYYYWKLAPEYYYNITEIDADRDQYFYISIYTMSIGGFFFLFEYFFGPSKRICTCIPLRGIIYISMAFVMFFAFPTVICGGQWVITGVFDVMAWWKKEEYGKKKDKKNKTKNKAVGGNDEDNENKQQRKCCDRGRIKSCCSKFCTTYFSCIPTPKGIAQWFRDFKLSTKRGAYVFSGLFLAFNAVFCINVYYDNYALVLSAADAVRDGTAFDAFGADAETVQKLASENRDNLLVSQALPFAKLFGTLLDINCAFILFPVCRTFISQLYNISTDQRWTSRTLGSILSFMPMDKALEWHKFMALLTLIGTVWHTTAHYIGFMDVPATYNAVFGLTVWVSGSIIIFCMQFIYGTSIAAVRHANFELFWYTHHLFVIFFIVYVFLLTCCVKTCFCGFFVLRLFVRLYVCCVCLFYLLLLWFWFVCCFGIVKCVVFSGVLCTVLFIAYCIDNNT